jgi:hypothetical protein
MDDKLAWIQDISAQKDARGRIIHADVMLLVSRRRDDGQDPPAEVHGPKSLGHAEMP